jgi:heptosyltransferase-3
MVIKLNITIINMGYIGDIINISPVVKALKKEYSQSNITVITSPVSVITAKSIPGVDDAEGFCRYNKHKGIKVLKFAIDYRKKHKPDIAIVLTENFRSALLSVLIGAKKRIGRDCDGRGFLLTHKIPFTQEEREQQLQIVEHYLRVLNPLKIDCSDKELEFDVLEDEKQKMYKLLNEINPDNAKLIGLCPATGSAGYLSMAKCWTVDEAFALIKYINQNTDYKVVVVGQEACYDFAQNLRKNGDVDFIDLTMKTTISELAALITLCEKFISVDSAPMHLSVAVKKPVISLFFETNHLKWAPADKIKNILLFNKENISSSEVIKALKI